MIVRGFASTVDGDYVEGDVEFRNEDGFLVSGQRTFGPFSGLWWEARDGIVTMEFGDE